MKKFRKLIPALAMLLVSAVLMSTASYAWFSMNTQVTATGMKVKATAEKGIVISNSLKSTWSDTSNAQVLSATLYPTSHAVSEGSAENSWVHNTSNDSEHAFPNQADGYEALTIVRSSSNEGIGYVEMGTNTVYDSATDPAYYLVNEFNIKSSDAEITTTNLFINDVTVASSGTVNALDVSLRVLVDVYEYSGSAYSLKKSAIYAPVAASPVFPTTQYNYKGLATGTTAVTALYGADHSTTFFDTDTTITTIPAYSTSNPIKVLVYVYFEGEDGNCRTKNINGITVNDLTVSVKFGTKALGSTAFTQGNYVALAQRMDNISSSVNSGSIEKGTAFSATYTAPTGYALPATITVKVNGTTLTAGSGYTWNQSTGALAIEAAQVTGAVEVTVIATHS